MPERVLAEALSGEEVVLAILDRIGARLRRDCFLTPNMAYQSFRCTVRIDLAAVDCGEDRMVKVEEKVTHNPEDADLNTSDAQDDYLEIEMGEQAPNETRVETGQGVPVLSKSVEGKPEVKHVKYARPKVKATA